MIATTSSNPRHSSSSNTAIIGLAAVALAVLCACGGASSPAQPLPAPTPTPTPAPTPTPSLASQLPPGLVCDPTPPPLYGLRLKQHNARTLDSRPQVINVNNYCARAGFDPGSKFCYTREEGDPQATACDYLAVGKASDTGRWGPTWSLNNQPCVANGGCTNHPDNQFLVLMNADGTYLACVAPEVPVSTDPARPGSRCGLCKVSAAGILCNEQAN
jgi:hypothetical protein